MPRAKKPKPLRPGPKPRGGEATRPIAVRVTEDERERYQAAAQRQGQTLTKWALEAFDLAVARGSTR